MLFTADRIESGFAVLIPDGDDKTTYDVPVSAFDVIPHEGDVFSAADEIISAPTDCTSESKLSDMSAFLSDAILNGGAPVFIFEKELTCERKEKAKSRFRRLLERKRKEK